MRPYTQLADPNVLTAAEEDRLLRHAPWRRLVVLGDSVAVGIGEPVEGYESLPWAERLARALGRQRPDLAYLNLGKRGLRAAEVRGTQLGPALSFGPDLAAVVCGGNDMLGGSFDAWQVGTEIEEVVSALRRAGADVLLFTMFDITRAVELPEPYGRRLRERASGLRAQIVGVAKARDAVLADMAGCARSADPGIYDADLRHANMRGHAVAASWAVRSLGERLGRGLETEAS